MPIDYQIFECFCFNDPIPDEVEDDAPIQPQKVARANYGWEEDEEDLQWKEPEVVIPYPLHCPITVLGAEDDERVRPHHCKEWTRLSHGKNESYFCKTGGYFFFKTDENEDLVKKKIVWICKGAENGCTKVKYREEDTVDDEVSDHRSSVEGETGVL